MASCQVSGRRRLTRGWRKRKGRKLWRVPGLPITRAASANQHIAINISREKPEGWPPCLPHKLTRSVRATDWRILNKTFKVSNDRDDQKYRLRSTEANYIPLKAGIRLLSSCVPPVNAVTTWWSDRQFVRGERRAFKLSAEPAMVGDCCHISGDETANIC